MRLAALAVLLSAFLLFLIQPLMGRLVVPLFGGGASVWTTCLVFFQGALVVGYGYAVLSTRWLSPRTQRLLHIALLATSIVALRLVPGDTLTPADGTDPQGRIVLLLLLTAGLPYMLLAATGPLVQSWLAAIGHSPWRLFAVSNAASIAALVAYPFAVEPFLGLATQARLWGAFYGLAALLVGLLAWRTPMPASPVRGGERQAPPPASTVLTWIVLAGLPTALLVAATDFLTRDLPAIPLLWILPLALYLLTLVVWFDGRLTFHRVFWLPCATLAVLVMARVMTAPQFNFEPFLSIPVFLAGLFAVCLFCHGELAARRPDVTQLGLYYLCLSGGGALGGTLVAIAAPWVLPDYYDLAILFAALAVPLGMGAARLDNRLFKLAGAGCALLVVAAGIYAGRLRYIANHRDTVSVQRNFYGVLKAIEAEKGTADSQRLLWHGGIIHGLQYLTPSRRREPTEYYREQSGVGLAIATLPAGPRRLGFVGLGVGTLAAYGRPGDEFVFYEIDPAVERVARRDFTFLADSQATLRIVSGDARLSLQREAPRGYGVLAIDAFSGNALPLHLLTVEAFAAYTRHVADDGILAINVSNKFFDLLPFVQAAATAQGWRAMLAVDGLMSDWVVLARDVERLRQAPLGKALVPLEATSVAPWTDDHADVVRALLP